MITSADKIPLINFKGENLHLVQINLGHSYISTKENHPGDETSKHENIINIKNNPIKVINQNTNKNNIILNKKTKREKILINNRKKIKDKKCKKYNIIINFFNEFKNSSPFYKEFLQFNIIEKNVKKGIYYLLKELVDDVHKVFSNLFLLFFNDSEKYNKTLILCELFEKIYKKYDNKILTKERKNLLKMINKLKKELSQNEILKNSNINNHYHKYNSNTVKYPYYSFKNKNQFIYLDKEISVKKYKNEILNKIKNLNKEQKKGLFNIVSNEYIGKNQQNNIMEININKMTFNQLQKLEEYVEKYIKDNNSGIDSPLEKNVDFSRNRFLGDESESSILKNDDLSSSFLDDEDGQ